MDRERIEDVFAPFGPVAVKRMFGGHGVFVDGLHIAIEHNGEIFLKTDPATQPLFEAAGSRPFTYRTSKKLITMSYWKLVDDALEDNDELRKWADLALSAARRAQTKKPARATREKRS